MNNQETIVTRFLIIGNSAAAIGAVEGIRTVDGTSPVVMVSDEPCLSYSRPLISKYLAGERTLEEILFRPPDFYSANRIDLLSGVRVEHLDIDNHVARLADGRKIGWRKVMLATGGAPVIPPLKGGNREGVFTFLTIGDAMAINHYIARGMRAIVIGGGLIGISVAEALIKRGLDVTVVEMKERILNTILDEEASPIAEKAYEKAGVKFITNHTVQEVLGDARVTGVVLDNGTEFPCDLVVIAIGVQPRVELALQAGIKVNRGILVDLFMATSHPDVYAAGDVAEAYDFVHQTNRLTPIWPNAYIGGRVAGMNMVGLETEYPGGTAMNSLNYFGIDIAAAGVVVPQTGLGYEVLEQQSDSAYKKIIINNNRIVGMLFIGDVERAGVIFGLMREKIDVTDFKQALLSENFGLACLPTEMRQRWLRNLAVTSK